MGISGKVAVVTGARRGIGRAIALRLARDGADIVINDLVDDGLSTLAQEISSLGRRAVPVLGDVSKESDVNALMAKTLEELGKIDIMVANAGIVSIKPALELTVADWDEVMAVNARGVFLCDQAAARQMIKQGRGGKIINCASAAGHEGFALEAHYCASKFAVVGFSQSFAKEMAKEGITVNCYCPGIVATDMWKLIDRSMSKYTGLGEGESMKSFLKEVPLGRTQTPEDVAGLVSFLASPDSDYMTGQAVLMDGGLVMR